MKTFKIFVEGDADINFIKQYIEYLFPIIKDKIPKEAIEKNIFSNALTEGFAKQIHISNEKNDITLIIFDSDPDGYKAMKDSLEAFKSTHGLTFETFLLPFNQEGDNGNLEFLLYELILDRARLLEYQDCYEKFEACILTEKQMPVGKEFNKLTKKYFIYDYLKRTASKDELVQAGKYLGEGQRKYNDGKWNFENAALMPLKDFLVKHLS